MRQMLKWIEKQLDRRVQHTSQFIVICSCSVLLERMDCLALLIRLNEEGSSLRLYLILVNSPDHSLPFRLIQPIRFRLVLGNVDAARLSGLLDQKVVFRSTQTRGVVLQESVSQMMLAEPCQKYDYPDVLWHLPVCPDIYPESWFRKGQIVLGADPVEGGCVSLSLKKDQCLWVLGFNESDRLKKQLLCSGYPVIGVDDAVDCPCIILLTVAQFQKMRFRTGTDLSFVLWTGPGLHQQMIFSVPSGIREQRGMRYFFHYGQCVELQGEKDEKRDHTVFQVSVQ